MTQLKQFAADAPYHSQVTKTAPNNKFEAQMPVYSEKCVTREAG
ncbi:hypothetical protein [Microcoleus sp. N3A4]